jgi:predicted metal-dependent hydrolase
LILPGLVLVFEDDLLFASRIEHGLDASGFQARFVSKISELTEALKSAPVLILINAGSQRLPWPRMVALAKERRLPPLAPALAYGPHVDLDLRQRALDAGCDAVVARSAIANSLPALLQRYAWKPDLSACERPLPDGIRKGIEQFNNGAFYRCHDSIEAVWVEEPGDVRLLYQGILQISVAFYHVQKGNWPGMIKMMERGKGKLMPFRPSCRGIDVAGLLLDVDRCQADLREMGPDGMARFDRFPSIRFS